MKIYIDISVLTLATFITGIQRVTRELSCRLLEENPEGTVLIYYNSSKDTYYRIKPEGFLDYYRRGQGVKEKMISSVKVPLSEIGEGCIFFDLDAAWMDRMNRSYLLPILKANGARIVSHIYDVISISYPQYCLERGVYNFTEYLGAHLFYDDAIICNAQATVLELEKLARKTGATLPVCHVVPLGADYRVETPDESAVPEKVRDAAESGKFLLMVGTVEPRKNHKLLLDAYDNGLKELGYHIIFAGYMGWNMDEFAERLNNHPDYEKGLWHFEGLNDDSITYLYKHTEYLVFASYAEGYGLPIIESLQRGTPVIAADIPVLREVGGNYCTYFPQDNAEAICKIIRGREENPEAYSELKANISGCRYPGWDESYKTLKKALELV